MPDEIKLKPLPLPFSLSKINVGFLAFTCAVIGGYHLRTMPWTAEGFGGLTGNILAICVLSLLPSWLVWLVSGRRLGAARVTFNVLLIMIVLGDFGEIARKARERTALDKLADRMESFRKEAAHSGAQPNPEGYSNLVQATQSTFAELADVSSGGDKRGWEIMGEFIKEIAQKSEEWQTSYINLVSEPMMDPVSLREESEMNRQKAAFEHHLKLTARAREDFLRMTVVMKERLEEAGAGKAMMTSIIRGIADSQSRQQAVFEKLTQAHTDYCNNAITALTLLKTESGKWEVQDGKAIMDGTLREDLLSHLEQLDKTFALIQELSDKLRLLAMP